MGLVFHPARIAGELAVFADDAVAGDEDGEGVFAVGGSDCADGFRVVDELGDIAVAGGFAVGDGLEGLPDLLLEVCAGWCE